MFEALRQGGWNVHYEGRRNTAANYDVTSIIIICITAIIAISIILSLVGQRRRKRV